MATHIIDICDTCGVASLSCAVDSTNVRIQLMTLLETGAQDLQPRCCRCQGKPDVPETIALLSDATEIAKKHLQVMRERGIEV